MSKITYADKVGIIPKTTRINQVWDDDMNEIKIVVNANDTITSANTTNIATNALGIDNLVTDLETKAEKDNIIFKAIDYTAVINDYVLVTTSVADITITLPTASGVIGKQINITKIDSTSFNVIVETTSSQTIIGQLTQTISKQWSNATFVSDGANWVIK